MSKLLKRIAMASALLFLLAQFVRPERTNPPVDPARTIYARTPPPPRVASILERSCGDCHSNETRWPWYSRVAPVSWFVANHVQHGRKHFNFSEWAESRSYGQAKDSDELLEKICREVRTAQMPMASYLLFHPQARLSPDAVQAICEWTEVDRGRTAQFPPAE